jgi:tetratricopeptide (TPR) repeat protein
LTEDDIRLAEQWALPEPWTTTWLQESLAVTLAWMQTTGEQRVPPILIPVADIERHIKDAASLLLDRHLATLPTCTPDMAATAYCRPSGMSVPAYAATYKLKDMAIADEILDLIPAELDLSTAVALYGRPFIEPLNDLDHARSALHALNQGLSLAGLLCLVLLALLWLLCSVTPKSRQHWLGATLLALALVAWAASYAAYALLPQWFIPQVSKELPANLSMPLEGFAGATLATAQNRIAAAALILAGLGLLLLWAPLLAPHQEAWTRPITTPQAARTGVILLAVASLLYVLYARTGERLYVRASQLYRDQDITAASALYRQIDRFYPFRITGRTGAGNAGSFVDHARRALYVSQLYLDAQAAFEVGEWQTAVQHDEALLLTQPSLSLRDRVQARLFEALIRWARSLEAGGQRERALDRYRFVRDEGLGRGQQVDEQPVRIHPTIGTLYIDWGDELKSQDPEAALATYRRALADTDDPGVWALAEQQMIDTYCAWSRQFREAGDAQRASRICIEFGTEFPALASYSCAACTP